jgi:hypothetical protein
MDDQLASVAAKIEKILAMKPECFITHPAELHVLKSVDPAELRHYAEMRGWRLVSRVGGRQIEFYNDAGAQAP